MTAPNMATIIELQEIAQSLGLSGSEAMTFIKEQQDLARTQRAEQREEEQKKREEEQRKREEEQRKREEAALQRAHEIQMATTYQSQNRPGNAPQNNSKAPKLPAFVDGKDMIDSYLQRFERFARSNGWEESQWAISLSALLTGQALDVYSRLSDEEANDYKKLKNGLLKRYNLTETGYRQKFRTCKPEPNETPEQFIFRLQVYLELSG